MLLAMSTRVRRSAVAAVAIGWLSLDSPAAAGEGAGEPASGAQACITAYERVQDLRGEGQLRAAKKQAIACARATCPEALSKDCRRWLDEIKLSIPSVVIDARNADGGFVSDVKVYFDGKLVAEGLDGRAIQVDPGAHEVRAEADDLPPVTLQVVIQEGQRNRKIDIAFEGPTEEREETGAEAGAPPAVWVFGGLAVTGVALGGVFLGLGLAKQSELDDCKPSCSADEVDTMMRYLAVGDIALAAGIVSAAAALTIYFTRPTASAAAQTGMQAPALAVRPTPGGLRGALSVSF